MTDVPESEAGDPVATAAAALYGAGLGGFVVERKRLADARKAAGDKPGAAAIAKLARPSMTAWVVNRLWRETQAEVDDLLAVGDRVRAGDRGALDVQRAILARLRTRAAAVLVGDGHAASPATLHRIATTLQALSALGTWAPDRPGQLVTDRDPPGFDVMIGAVLEPGAVVARASASAAPVDGTVAAVAVVDLEGVARAEHARRRAAERAALTQAATAARREFDQRTAQRDRARIEVEAAEMALARAQARCASADADHATAASRSAAADAAVAAHDAHDAPDTHDTHDHTD